MVSASKLSLIPHFDGQTKTPYRVLRRSELQTYPSSYTLLLFADEEVSLRTQRVFERFSSVYDLSTRDVVQRIVLALQGDDEINGGELQDSQDLELEEPGGWEEPARGFETAKGAEGDLGRNWTVLKE